MLAGALLLSLAAQGARAEFPAFPFSSIPTCVTDCVEKAGCNAVDLRCMCEKSSGTFLPEVAACIRAGCDPSMSVDTLIEPLVNTCGTMDAPVPSGAVSSAHGAATGGGGGYATQAPGEPSAVPKPPPRTTATTLTTSTNAATETPTTSAPETTAATTTEGETAPTGTAAPTSPDESNPSSAPPESAAPIDRASLLCASVGFLLVLAVGW